MPEGERALGVAVVLTLAAGAVSLAAEARGGRDITALRSRQHTTPDGRLRFSAPAGWRVVECHLPGDPICVAIAPPGAGDGDHVEVRFLSQTGPHTGESGRKEPLFLDAVPIAWPPPDENGPIARTMGEYPRPDQVTVAGAPGWRYDIDVSGEGGMVVVTGDIRSHPDRVYHVWCTYDARRREVRAGCERVLDSLRLTTPS